MRRPEAMDGRTERITIRLTREEREQLKVLAKSLGKAESEFVRDAIVGRQRRYARRPMSDGAAANYEIAMRLRLGADEIRELLNEMPLYTDAESVALCSGLIEKEVDQMLADSGQLGDYVDLPDNGEVLPPLGELH